MHGYFVMPLLAGGRLVGRVDPAREGRTLVARQLTLDRPSAAEPMARALKEAATWVNCDYVELEQVEPTSARDRLQALLKSPKCLVWCEGLAGRARAQVAEQSRSGGARCRGSGDARIRCRQCHIAHTRV